MEFQNGGIVKVKVLVGMNIFEGMDVVHETMLI